MNSYWDSLAQQFQHQQPPLRPCAEDTAILHRIVHAWQAQHSSSQIKVLLLGVTPEIATLSWPPNTSLLAVEKSQAMIERVWPGNIPDRRHAIPGNWFDIDLPNGSFDFVVGDGFSTGLAYPNQYHQIAQTISKWLKPNGQLIARLFVRADKKETHEKIMADLKARRVRSFDTLKWRLAMAIQENVRQGVIVDEIYRAWTRLEENWPRLPEEAGWPRATVNTIKLYEGRGDRYAFPTVPELSDAFSSSLEPVSINIPGYDFGPCCPTLVYRRRTPVTMAEDC